MVKRLRAIRLDSSSTTKWQDLSPKVATTQIQKYRQRSSSYGRATNHFAPMLSTLNMQPKVVLTRTTINSTAYLIQKSKSKNKMFPDGSGYCDQWIVLDSIKEEYLGVEKTTSCAIGYDKTQVILLRLCSRLYGL